MRIDAPRPRPVVPLPTHAALRLPRGGLRRELAAPWPSCAPCGPSAPATCPVPHAGEGGGQSSYPARRGPRRPGGVAPRRWGRLQCPQAGKRRPQRRGTPGGRAAATPAVGRWVRAPRGRPSRSIRYSRACGLAATPVLCDCMQSHLPGVISWLPSPPGAWSATCSPQYSARARLSRAPPRHPGAVAGVAGDP